MNQRAVISGLGIAAPTGLDVEEHWAAVLRGSSSIRPLTRFDAAGYPSKLAGEVTGFEPGKYLPSRLLPQTDHMTRLALVAGDRALSDAAVSAGSDELGEFDVGVVTASSSGGFDFGQRELEKLWSKGGEYVSAYQSFAWFYAVNTGQISIRNGVRGPSGVVVSDQAGGLDALAQARRLIRRGTRAIVSGAVDSSLCPWGWVALQTGGRLSRVNVPERAYVPFDADANGHVAGEGGAILVVESDASAHQRSGVQVYGEIAGWGSTVDPKPGSDRGPGLRRAITSALADAAMSASEVDVVFADAAGTPELDRVESDALATVFGPEGVPVTAPKTMTGRLYSGAGALDVATAVLAMRDDVIPPTINSVPDESYRLDLVTDQPREARLRAALVLARGHGGFNSAVVLRAPETDQASA